LAADSFDDRVNNADVPLKPAENDA
jgi:hypothetical protein